MTLYVVTARGQKPRLIEARTRTTARSFVARETVEVKRAKPADAHELAKDDVSIETATEDGGDE